VKQAADREFVAMRRITETLMTLDKAERTRVLSYVNARVDAMPEPQPGPGPSVAAVPAQPGQPALL
jgi:hypothetical protein